MGKFNFLILVLGAVIGLTALTAVKAQAYGSMGTAVNDACAPEVIYTGDCTTCHTGSKGDPTDAKTAYKAGGSTLTDFFCPADPTPVDVDGDGFTVDEGDCNDSNPDINPDATDIPNNGIDENCDGADSIDTSILDSDNDGFTPAEGDCNDTNAAINPGAVENCNDQIDNNCNGLVDDADPAAVGCVIDPNLIDFDNDGFTPNEGDCNDADDTVFPGAVENCTDGIDNNCNGYIDTQDSTAVNCPVTCEDLDNDFYAVEGGECGPIDCNDTDAAINPAASESCNDGIDNDCDTKVDCEDSSCIGDSACLAATCEDYNSRNTCKADKRCDYSGKSKSCFSLPEGQVQCKEEGGRWNIKKGTCRK